MQRSVTRREFLAFAAWDWIWPFRRDAEIAGVRFRVVRRGTDRRRYIWIHGNERTAADVLSDHMNRVDGRAFLVRNGGERNVPFNGGVLDPNRMFSREGAERNLRSLNPNWTDAELGRALDRLDRGRDGFLRRILPSERGGVLVALHNNGPGYSVQDEIPISDAVALNDAAHLDEFMLCTQRPDFEVLAGGRYNVVLQNRVPREDDGSLSRLCAARGIRYVNIEAAHGNAEAQRRMLHWLDAVL